MEHDFIEKILSWMHHVYLPAANVCEFIICLFDHISQNLICRYSVYSLSRNRLSRNFGCVEFFFWSQPNGSLCIFTPFKGVKNTNILMAKNQSYLPPGIISN